MDIYKQDKLTKKKKIKFNVLNLNIYNNWIDLSSDNLKSKVFLKLYSSTSHPHPYP